MPSGKKCSVLWIKCSRILARECVFPLFIPKSYFSKEAPMFRVCQRVCCGHSLPIKECRWRIGHCSRWNGQLEEELIVRPTSETIIWIRIENGCNRTAIFRYSTTNGPMWYAGRWEHVYFKNIRISVARRPYGSRYQARGDRRGRAHDACVRDFANVSWPCL